MAIRRGGPARLTLALWHAWSRIHLGWALSQGDAARGLEEIEAGLREAREIGAGRYEPFHLSIAADAYARADRQVEARSSIAKAFEGLALGQHSAFAAAAAADLRCALDLARQQKALSLQLRAAGDLARLLAEQGEKRQAADLLAPVYSTFTEGFDTPDLIEAKALVDDLLGKMRRRLCHVARDSAMQAPDIVLSYL
jgi:hypothetical protein